MQQPGTELARVGTYAELLTALVARRHDISMPQRAIDDVAGLPDGYCAKIECGTKRLGMMSLECVLGALGVELVVVAKTPHHVAQGRIVQTTSAVLRQPTTTSVPTRRSKLLEFLSAT